MSLPLNIPVKKARLVQVGKNLILSKGFTATSVDEMCEGAEVTKGTFYYYFKNKEQFAKSLLETIWEPVESMQHTFESGDVDALAHLYEHMDFMAQFLIGDGKLIPILAQELSETHPEIGKQCRGYFRQWTQDYLLEIIHHIQAGHPSDSDSQSIMEFILMAIEGVPVVYNQYGQAAVDRAMSHLRKYVQTLFQVE